MRPSVLQKLEFFFFDVAVARLNPPPVKEKILVVLATERSMLALQQWPWPRSTHAQLLGQLGLSKLVVLDILFSERSSPADDALLVAVVARMGNVLLASHLAPGADGRFSSLVPPYRELFEASAGIGISNLLPEQDGIYRNSVPFREVQKEIIPSLPFAALTALQAQPPQLWQDEKTGIYSITLSSRTLKLDDHRQHNVVHPRVEFPCYEYIDVLNGAVPPSVFRDAVVVVGVAATGAEDYFSVGLGRVLPGTLYNAHAIWSLLHGEIPLRCSRWVDAVLGGCAVLVSIAIGFWGGIRRGLVLFFCVVMGYCLVVASLLFLWLLWIPVVSPILTASLAYFIAVYLKLNNLFGEWEIRELPIDSLLLLSERAPEPEMEEVDFPFYLRASWGRIESKTGIALISVRATERDHSVLECLLRMPGEPSADRLSILTNCVPHSMHPHRTLIPLHTAEDVEREFVVLGWRGRKGLDTIRSVAAVVLSTSVYFRAIEENRAKKELFFNVIQAMVGAIDAKDALTAGHSERVARLGRQLATKMGLPPHVVEDVYIAGILHDVGKIGIPDAVLNKPGRLSYDEMHIMSGHPLIGAVLMEPIGLPESVLMGILEHHERPDGMGYPNRIKGEEGNLVGKILKVVDVFDALTSKRQYKEPWSEREAYQFLEKGSGTEFDLSIVQTLLDQPFEEERPPRSR